MIVLDNTTCPPIALPQKPVVPRLKELHVRFRYHSGAQVDFHGVDHSFVLCLETREPYPNDQSSNGSWMANVGVPKRPRVQPRVPSAAAVAAAVATPLKKDSAWANHQKWLAIVLASVAAMWWYMSSRPASA